MSVAAPRPQARQHFLAGLPDIAGAKRDHYVPFFGGMTSIQVDRVCNTLEKLLEKTLVGKKGRF